jgi:RHS repeat-associated protein
MGRCIVRVRWVVGLCLVVLSALAPSADATSSVGSSEAPEIREALSRQLQSSGPVIASKGGSGGSGDAAAPAGEPVAALATADSRTWQLHDGPRVTRIYQSPVNFKGSDGKWHAIQNELVGSPLGGYENSANSFSLKVPDSLQSSVSLSFGGQTLSFALQHALTGTPSVSGDTATYANALPATDLVYTSESTGVRETATLKGPEAPQQLSYTLSLPEGVKTSPRSDGSIALVDSTGVVVFTIPAPVAFRPGQGPAAGRALPMSIAPEGNGYVLTVDTSAPWLREMLASGPVAVDPTVVAASQACTLNAESPKTSSCSASTLQEGYDSTHQEHHSLLEFSMSSIPQAALVLNAKLGLYVEAKSTSTAKAVGVYRVTKPWTTGATWESYNGTTAWGTAGGDYSNPSSKSDAVVNSSVGASTGWYYWYPTKMVQAWANTANAPEQEPGYREGANNEGLIVKDQTDNATQNLLTIASPTAAANTPYLEVVYDDRGQGESPQYTQLSTSLTDKLQVNVNVGSGNLMLANQAMHIAGTNGMDYQSTLYSNSLDPDIHDIGRWRESMFIELGEFANGDIYTSNGTGQHYLFQKQSTGAYLSPPGIKAKMCTAATSSETPCKPLPSGVSYRLQYEDPAESYVDFTSYGWAEHFGNKYEPKLTAGYTEGVDAITSWTDTQGRTIKYKVAPNSFYTEVKDEAGGRAAKFELESETGSFAQLLATTDASGRTTKYHYEFGNLDKVTDPSGVVTKFLYDPQHRIEAITRGVGTAQEATTRFEYKELGKAPEPCTTSEKATIVKDPDWTKAGEHETTYCVNVLDEVDKTIDAQKHETQFEYNPFGEQTVSKAGAPGTGESGGVQNLNYGTAGVSVECAISGNTSPTSKCPNRTTEEGKQSLITSFEYKDANNKFSTSQVTDPQGNQISPCYNGGSLSCTHTTGPAGSLSSKTDQLASEKELTFEYNANGTLKASTDAAGAKTEYLYDEKGNLKEIKPPSGSGIEPTKISVDADSRPEVITDGAGHKETITYDKADRVTKTVFSGVGTEKTVSYEYDGAGNLVKREDSTGTSKYTRDALNRLTKEELPGSVTHSYTYDAASNMKSFTDGGGTTNYAYNGLNELESMTEPSTLGTDKFTYDNNHRLTKIEYPSKAVENYKLDAATGRVERLTPEGVLGAQTLSYTYTKGANNQQQIQTMAESPAGATTTYSYDVLNRLKEAATTGARQTHYLFALDGDGNRISQQVNLSEKEGGQTGGTTTYYHYKPGNELECHLTLSSTCTHSTSTELTGYEYDKAGEQTAIVAKGDPSSSTFAYNAASELSTLTPGGESALSLTYGGSGQDDLITKGSSTTLENSLLGITREIASGSAYCFERTPEGLLIDIRTPSGNYNPLYDAQGDIVGLVNSSKELKRSFRYGPYGENVKAEGTETVPFIFGYKGGYRMPGGNKAEGEGRLANGLYHYGQRYYDPTTGRWTQQDPTSKIASPVQGDRFLFVGSDPINRGDPGGTEFFEEEAERIERGASEDWEKLENAGKQIITWKEEAREWLSENAFKCSPGQVSFGHTCQRKPQEPDAPGPPEPPAPVYP